MGIKFIKNKLKQAIFGVINNNGGAIVITEFMFGTFPGVKQPVSVSGLYIYLCIVLCQ